MKKISVRGPIIPNNDQWIYDLFGIEATSPSKVQSELEGTGDVELEINSGGGSVFDGSDIYTMLRDHKGNVTGKVMGLAASAASVIAMAADNLMMSPTAQMMMHNASSIAIGDYRDFEHESEVLKNVNQTIANAYRMKSGMNDEQLLQMMDKETWLTPQQAKEHNLIDGIMFESEPMMVASVNQSGLLPPEVINKIRNEQQKNIFNQSSHEQEHDEDFYMHNLRKKKLEIINKEVI
ncbi:Endopeptidase Clp [Lentibacillus sp. JNUCC-1]|uniref:head maturation protease, ClpP-related n=1 Tax=Lentibacillus sp. JNUCC-1 TaxID=2654513 RepID=UPI0012E87363|nr:head maturation protease, ClpP-related [Lentibacillus sp. JNUCC-1]MUV39470.1 Endopeptidase Clp [Lentibacillus sp. JNUCC-1]